MSHSKELPVGNAAKPLPRRQMLQLLGSAAIAPLASHGSATARPPRKSLPPKGLADPIHYSSATALAAAIRRGKISCEDVIRAHLERIEAVNPKLNAVVQLARDQALERARFLDAATARFKGPLHGVPITIKDSLDTAGIISTGGTRGRARHVPARDATVVARLKSAGAIVLGKTNTPELTYSAETDNLVYGRTNNPYDPSRTPGGSSGGAAAIVAAGGAALDVGSDTGGSIRIPSHWCGLAGIKPTSGRVPRTGHIVPFGGILDSLTQLGPIARNVDDLVAPLLMMCGQDWRDPAVVPMPLEQPDGVDLRKLRIAFHTTNGLTTPTPEIVDAVRRAADALAEGGAKVEEARPEGLAGAFPLGMALLMADGGHGARRMLERAGTTEHSLPWLEEARPAAMADYLALKDRWDDFRRSMIAFVEERDILLGPVNPVPAPAHGTIADPAKWPLYMGYTLPFNMTGWPAAVVRTGASPQGLPIGVQIVARPWREDVALAVARRLEESGGGFRAPSL